MSIICRAGDANEFSAFCYADTLRAQIFPVANLTFVFDTLHVQTFLCSRPSIKFINVLVQSYDLHNGLVSLFLSILNLQGRLNLSNKKQSHIYLNLFIAHMTLGLVPEVLDPIDMVLTVGKEL